MCVCSQVPPFVFTIWRWMRLNYKKCHHHQDYIHIPFFLLYFTFILIFLCSPTLHGEHAIRITHTNRFFFALLGFFLFLLYFLAECVSLRLWSVCVCTLAITSSSVHTYARREMFLSHLDDLLQEKIRQFQACNTMCVMDTVYLIYATPTHMCVFESRRSIWMNRKELYLKQGKKYALEIERLTMVNHSVTRLCNIWVKRCHSNSPLTCCCFLSTYFFYFFAFSLSISFNLSLSLSAIVLIAFLLYSWFALLLFSNYATTRDVSQCESHQH